MEKQNQEQDERKERPYVQMDLESWANEQAEEHKIAKDPSYRALKMVERHLNRINPVYEENIYDKQNTNAFFQDITTYQARSHYLNRVLEKKSLLSDYTVAAIEKAKVDLENRISQRKESFKRAVLDKSKDEWNPKNDLMKCLFAINDPELFEEVCVSFTELAKWLLPKHIYFDMRFIPQKNDYMADLEDFRMAEQIANHTRDPVAYREFVRSVYFNITQKHSCAVSDNNSLSWNMRNNLLEYLENQRKQFENSAPLEVRVASLERIAELAQKHDLPEFAQEFKEKAERERKRLQDNQTAERRYEKK